jgi:F-type H+-transporting ATPase subunit gamma
VANLQDIKRRIGSVENTKKITSAMKMVAASKLRRAQDAIESARPYAHRMRATLEEVAAAQVDAEHPLLQVRDEVRSLEVIVITSDRGLAGAFNNAIGKRTEKMLLEREPALDKVSLNLVGKKGVDYYRRRRASEIVRTRAIGAQVTYAEASQLAQEVSERYASGEVDEVLLVYNEFVSTMTQRPTIVTLLPFTPPEASGDEEALSYEIEPSPEKLLGTLVPKAVEVEVFRAMLESQAGEHAARMTAMESATKNTEELIEKLTLKYNRARQAAITSELVEIVTGAQALE